jgi:hypothetical protein
MARESQRNRAEQYPSLLTADPPVCRVGPPLAVLRRCERLRRDEVCWCRFAAADLADELSEAGAPELGDYFATALEPEDVNELSSRVRALAASGIPDEDLADSVARLSRRLRRLVEAESGLTDRYSDDLDN